ncbi:MAG: hypothetical protein KGQ59_07855 [Bdellovibrionales bacterium]|nr:hypothetical protein [Bdellovibrionales bacterium]
MKRLMILIVSALALFGASCGKLNTMNSVSNDGSSSSGSPQFQAFKAFVASKCANCHDHARFAGYSEEEWVSVGLVVAGSPNASLFLKRMQNNGLSPADQGTATANMPTQGGPSSDAEVAIVRAWITSLSP